MSKNVLNVLNILCLKNFVSEYFLFQEILSPKMIHLTKFGPKIDLKNKFRPKAILGPKKLV